MGEVRRLPVRIAAEVWDEHMRRLDEVMRANYRLMRVCRDLMRTNARLKRELDARTS